MSLKNVEDAFALSPIQTGMLYDSLSTPNKDVYVTYVTVDVVGNVDTTSGTQSRISLGRSRRTFTGYFEGDNFAMGNARLVLIQH